MVWPQKSMQE